MMTPAEMAHRGKGLVKHNGTWMTVAERDKLTAAAQKSAGKPTQAPAPPAPQPAAVTPPPAPPAADTPDPAEVAEYCAANGRPDMAAKFIRDRMPMAEIQRLVDVSGSIRTQFEAARRVNPDIPASMLDQMLAGIALGTTSPEIAGKLFCTWLADNQSDEIRGHLSSGDIAGNAAGNHGWDRAMAQAGRAKVPR